MISSKLKKLSTSPEWLDLRGKGPLQGQQLTLPQESTIDGSLVRKYHVCIDEFK